MTLLEFGQRAFDHGGATLTTSVQLTGCGGQHPQGFQLAHTRSPVAPPTPPRLPSAAGADGSPPRDAWVTVTGSLARRARTTTATSRPRYTSGRS
jgi:hypothetical protein